MIYEVHVSHRAWRDDCTGHWVSLTFSRLFYKKENAEKFESDIMSGVEMAWLDSPTVYILDRAVEDENQNS